MISLPICLSGVDPDVFKFPNKISTKIFPINCQFTIVWYIFNQVQFPGERYEDISNICGDQWVIIYIILIKMVKIGFSINIKRTPPSSEILQTYIFLVLISAHTDGGPRSRVRASRPSAWPPINLSGNLSIHMSSKSPSNASPNPSEVISNVLES